MVLEPYGVDGDTARYLLYTQAAYARCDRVGHSAVSGELAAFGCRVADTLYDDVAIECAVGADFPVKCGFGT